MSRHHWLSSAMSMRARSITWRVMGFDILASCDHEKLHRDSNAAQKDTGEPREHRSGPDLDT
jgi:hypothetical protein